MNAFTFTHDAMSCAGRSFPARYVVEGTGAVVVYATMPGQDAPQAIRFDARSEYHAAALAAATGEPDTETAPAPAEFETISGPGWRIVFDSAVQRTRVYVEESAPDAIREAVQEAGFYYSSIGKSYNKKLTAKARRAALALAESIKAIQAA